MKNNYRFWIVLSFLVVFAAGILGGVILEQNILHPKSKRQDHDGRRDRPHFPTLNEMEEVLALSPEQQDRMRAVFQQNEDRLKKLREDMFKEFGSLRDLFLQEIRDVLDPEQVGKFNAILEEYRAQRQAEAERRKNRSPHSPQKKEDKGESR